MTTIRDIALFIANFGLPVYLVARLGSRGVVAGAFCMWVLVYASGEIQRADDPQAERFAMGLWLIVGLPSSFLYCASVQLIFNHSSSSPHRRGDIASDVRQWLRMRRYRVGQTVTCFVARDVRREIEILDTRRLGEGFITARVRTTNVLYHLKGLTPESEFGEPREIALVDLWHWDGQPQGGLPDGTFLVSSNQPAKKDA